MTSAQDIVASLEPGLTDAELDKWFKGLVDNSPSIEYGLLDYSDVDLTYFDLEGYPEVDTSQLYPSPSPSPSPSLYHSDTDNTQAPVNPVNPVLTIESNSLQYIKFLEEKIDRLRKVHKRTANSFKTRGLTSKQRKQTLNRDASQIARLRKKLQKAQREKVLLAALSRLEEVDPEWEPPYSIKIEKK